MNKVKLNKIFQDEGFYVHMSKQDNVQCADIEMWTDGGVDMIIWLNPFSIDEFEERINNFDIDEQIDLHREDENYKRVFTIRQSLNDFEKYYNKLKKTLKKLKENEQGRMVKPKAKTHL